MPHWCPIGAPLVILVPHWCPVGAPLLVPHWCPIGAPGHSLLVWDKNHCGCLYIYIHISSMFHYSCSNKPLLLGHIPILVGCIPPWLIQESQKPFCLSILHFPQQRASISRKSNMTAGWETTWLKRAAQKNIGTRIPVSPKKMDGNCNQSDPLPTAIGRRVLQDEKTLMCGRFQSIRLPPVIIQSSWMTMT